MSILKSMFKNTLLFSIGNILNRVFAFFLIVAIARYLGDVGLGIYSFAFAFMEVAGLFSEFGIYTLVVRSVARDTKRTKRFLDNYFTLKLCLLIVFTIIINIGVFLSPYDTSRQLVVFLASIAYLLLQMQNPFFAIFQAHERLEFESGIRTIESLLNLALAITAISLGKGILSVLIAIIISRAIVLTLGFLVFSKAYMLPHIHLNLKFWKRLIKDSLPFWLTNIFNTLYFYFDTLMLSFLLGAAVTGWYNASYRLVAALTFIPITVMYVSFPIMSRLHLQNKKTLQFMFNRLLKYLLTIIIPVAFGSTLLAERIITQIYGDQFLNSIIVLKILIWAEIFVFVNQVSIILLNASNQQRAVARTVGICAGINILLNFVLIPSYQHTGAAIATLIAQAANFIILYHLISTRLFPVQAKMNTAKIVFASILMSLATRFALYDYNILINIAISGIIYLGLALLIRIIDTQDIDFIKTSLKRRKTLKG
ncbi:flippase [Candidatus Woesearchaeota archaeon]|nr:flippase [Candidatus Woesearchaeota archaeon]